MSNENRKLSKVDYMIQEFDPLNPDPNPKRTQLESIADANVLSESFKKSKRGTQWKASVQKFEHKELCYIRELQQGIRNDSYVQKPINEFTLNERGHTRDIKAHHISDRVVQRAFNDKIYLPAIENRLIYNNGASMQGKGLSFARTQFENDLREAYQEYNGDCYILFMDFSKFFDNIQHQIVFQQLSTLLNPDELAFLQLCFREFEIDVSYMDNDEYENCLNVLFNSLDYIKIDNSLKTGEKFMAKSVGIGSQLSQLTGIYYPHQIDNYCTIVKGCRRYGRYMDDIYIILKTKEELYQLYNEILAICAQLGIFINQRKTRVNHITHQLSFLKINYIFTETGKLIRKVQSETFHREHRRLTKFKHLVDIGKMTLEQAIDCYKGWRGTYAKFDSGYEIFEMDNYVRQLFNLPYTTKFTSKYAAMHS